MLSHLLCSFIFFLASISQAYVSLRPAGDGHAGCLKLADRFPTKLFWPQTTTYINESTSLWSRSCILSPGCVFRPDGAADVAAALSIIRETNSPFAVRSGGHMPIPGAASTDSGIMIALSNLNKKTLIHSQTIAQIGPGQTWEEVYDWISSSGLGVAGGRYGSVGVGGLLLGGGINYFGNSFGWSVNNIVQYEIVLADSSIIDVSANSHPDLFWALKGGSNNFGIVTRFDMKTFPITKAFVAGVLWREVAIPAFLDAVSSFVQPGGGSSDPLVAINPAIAITPGNGVKEATNIALHRGSDPAPTSLRDFTNISGAFFNETSVRDNWASLPAELGQQSIVNRNSRQLFWSLGLKPTAEAIKLANDIVIGGSLEQLKNVANCSLSLAFQPITQAWLKAARASGGDAIDLDPNDGTFLAILISTAWSDAVDDDIVYSFSRDAGAKLIQEAKTAGQYYPFIYLNDAAKGQNPFSLYGKGKSLPRLKQVRRRYDPNGIFQQFEGSGFKLGL